MICNKLAKCAETCLYRNANTLCNRDNCLEICDNRSKVTCKEKSRSYSFLNTRGSKVALYHMDGGIIDDNTLMRCDYCLLTDNAGIIAVLIELKGTDVPHAIAQILESMNCFNSFFNDCKRVHARVVGTSAVPKIMATPNAVRLKKKLLARNGTFEIVTRKKEEKDTSLI